MSTIQAIYMLGTIYACFEMAEILRWKGEKTYCEAFLDKVREVNSKVCNANIELAVRNFNNELCVSELLTLSQVEEMINDLGNRLKAHNI